MKRALIALALAMAAGLSVMSTAEMGAPGVAVYWAIVAAYWALRLWEEMMRK